MEQSSLPQLKQTEFDSWQPPEASQRIETTEDYAKLENSLQNYETIMEVPEFSELNESNQDSFFSRRWNQIMDGSSKVAEIGTELKQKYWDIDIDDPLVDSGTYKLSFAENLKVRVGRIPHLIKYWTTPEVDERTESAAFNRKNNPLGREYAKTNADKMLSRNDWLKIYAYEAITLAPIRGLGMVALEAATKPYVESSEVVNKLHNHSKAWREAHRHEEIVTSKDTGARKQRKVSLHSRTARKHLIGSNVNPIALKMGKAEPVQRRRTEFHDFE